MEEREQKANKQMIRKSKKEEIFFGLVWSNLLCVVMNSYYWHLNLPKLLIAMLVIDLCCYVSYMYELDLLFNKKEERKEKDEKH